MTAAEGDSGTVTYEVADGVALITLVRPSKRNAIDLPMANALRNAFERFGRDTEARAGVLTGSGSAFCSGGDVSMFPNLDAESGLRFVRDLGAPIHMFPSKIRKPIIASVHGPCLAGGFELALACSFIYASQDATFSMEEVRLGLMPGWGGTVRLARAVPQRMATEMLLSSRRLSASEAEAWGLVNRVLEDRSSCLEQALATAASIAAMPVQAVELILDVVRASQLAGDAAFNTEQMATALLFGDSRTHAAIRGALERSSKRPKT